LTILEELIKEAGTSDLTEQVRSICEKIYNEEKLSFQYPEVEPKGPNIFLAVEVPGKTDRQIGYLTLERESEEDYVVVFYMVDINKIIKDNREESTSPRKIKAWEVSEIYAEKILTHFAKICKTLRGK